jgi:hypothetical protein
MPEHGPASMSPDPLAEWVRKAPVANTHAEAHEPPPAAATRARAGLMPFVVVGVVFIIVMRIFFQARGGGDWIRFIGPLLLIAFVLHGLWKARQRRDAKKTTPG